jgi:integrase
MGSIYRRGRIYWIAYVDRRGQQHCESSRLKGVRSGTNHNDAKRLLAEREGKISEGVPVTKDSARFNFRDAAQLITDNYIARGRKTLVDTQRRLDKYLIPHFGDLLMTEITSDVIDAFVAARKEASTTNSEINRELAVLKRGFTLAMRARKAFARPHIEMLKEPPPRSGFFEYSAFIAVRDLLPVEVRPLFEFTYITGWRWNSEVRTLTWSQVDFDHGIVTIPPGQTKGEEGRTFVMTPELRKLLKKQRTVTDALDERAEKPCVWVFHREGEQLVHFYRQWRKACDDAKVPGKLLHDMRRTAIRNLVRAGVSERVAMQMCGHKTRSIFDRYNITSENDLRSAATLLSAHHKTLVRQARTTKLLRSGRRKAAVQKKTA